MGIDLDNVEINYKIPHPIKLFLTFLVSFVLFIITFLVRNWAEFSDLSTFHAQYWLSELLYVISILTFGFTLQQVWAFISYCLGDKN